ncbi:MAG: YeeE/YedE family protein [Candidatus Kariarchaeaceae archaeon]
MSIGLEATLISLLIGISVGILLQKGRACTNTAFRNFLLFRNNELISFVVIAVCIQLIGYYFLSVASIPGFAFNSNPIEFSYLFIPLGGFLFGFGTVIAGGCAGGICYRIGEGSGASGLGFLGFATGIGLIARGPGSNNINDVRDSTNLEINGQTPSLTHFLPRIIWTLLAAIILILIIYQYNTKTQQGNTKLIHLKSNWTPITVGIGLGVLGVVARFASTKSGREFGLSTTDGIGEIFDSILNFVSIGWAGIFIIGLIFGALISASSGNEFKISIPSKNEFFRFYFGGLLLGIGAMLGYGCNFGHIFGGIPELGISSFVALIFMLFGNRVGSHLFYIKFNQPFPDSTPQSIRIGQTT